MSEENSSPMDNQSDSPHNDNNNHHHNNNNNNSPNNDDRNKNSNEMKDENVDINHNEEPSESYKLFIGGLNWATTESGLSKFFSQFGSVYSSVVQKDNRTGNSRGFGFIHYNNQAGVDNCLNKQKENRGFLELDGRKVVARLALPKSEQVRFISRQYN
jgi:RNA recognition motif-containing protein